MSEEVRIGVYVCHCGGNISDYVDVKKVVEAVKNEPGVVVAKDMMFTCSDASQNEIIEDIKKYKLNRIVVASCSPKLHEATFRSTLERAGLNPYLYYHANIREHVSWAHTNDPKGATEKAIRHVRAAIAYVRLAKPLEKIRSPSTNSVLIIGGGVAGLKAAIDLADMGVSVHLVEKEPFLGGRVAQHYKIYPSGEGGVEFVEKLIEEVKRRSNIAVYTNAEVESFSGYIGNFTVKIRVKPRGVVKKVDKKLLEKAISECPVEVPSEFDYGVRTRRAIWYPYDGAYPELPVIDFDKCTKCGRCREILGDAVDLNQKPETITIKVGAIIVATGFNPYTPEKGEYGYKVYKNVVTLQELQRIMALNNGEVVINGVKPRSIAFIHCVGCMEQPTGEGEAREYCSRYCCTASMHTGIEIMERNPGVNVYFIHKHIRSYGHLELIYKRACELGGVFIRYPEYSKPEVTEEKGKLVVKVKDIFTYGREVRVPVDLVVLVTAITPRDNKDLVDKLKIPVGKYGFYQEAHPKLRPVETNIAGLFIAGCAQAPRNVVESIASAEAAAAKSAAIALKKEIELEPFVAEIDPSKCTMCGECIKECAYEAIEKRVIEGYGEKAWVNEAKCRGCGACVAVCPEAAINLRGLTNEQVVAMIRAAGREVKL